MVTGSSPGIQIVANGTPADLKSRSDLAGAVTVRVMGVAATAVSSKLEGLSTVRKTVVVEDGEASVVVRAFPAASSRDGDLPRCIAELAQGENWKLEELHTEEGRLDEVFRTITRPDTVRES